MPRRELKKKVVLLGNPMVGKTSLVRRFVHDIFEDSYVQTIGTKVTKKRVSISPLEGEMIVTMTLWDVIGRRGYIAVHADAFAGAHGAILVSDLTRKVTLSSLERYWIPLLFEVTGAVPLIFVANKRDLKGQETFSLEDLGEVASRYNRGILDALPGDTLPYTETSALTGENVEEVFRSVAHLIASPKLIENPIKEIYESMVALEVAHRAKGRTLLHAVDALIFEFCRAFDDKETAMAVLTAEFSRAGLDPSHPTKDALRKAMEFLAEEEAEVIGEKEAQSNMKKRLRTLASLN